MSYPHTVKTYAEVLKQAIEEKWRSYPVECPHCRNGAVIFEEPKDYGDPDDNPCSCSWCTAEWNWSDRDD